jgi:hypothetical protein
MIVSTKDVEWMIANNKLRENTINLIGFLCKLCVDKADDIEMYHITRYTERQMKLKSQTESGVGPRTPQAGITK